ncbi:uncharacterized protein JN550_003426 [Neoarthrinium moseri]|uniref:uncharacterized protein n=1 Tax=Neoarthrinium moseri TaxID=1658444 RepID=UPI001FDAD9DB|nr:uncharacterized protein JN550_003426 [Neoarthrinium moseri]KAI1873173.1 hypothetical protein JN550_003426 [Neoarthrinium moseri]
MASQGGSNDNNKSADAPPYTREERAWLKDNYRGEFHFVNSYELSIHSDADQEEGRRIARGLIESDSLGSESGAGQEQQQQSSGSQGQKSAETRK